MTESEYIEHILRNARSYIAEMDREPGETMSMKIISEWEHVKTMLSAHTTVRLCELWLENREKANT